TAPLLALVTAAVLAAAGCSSGSGSKDTKGDDRASSAVPHTLQLPKLTGQKLKVTAVWTGVEQQNFTKVLDEFHRRTGADVSFVPSGDDMSSFVGSKIACGDPPDVAMLQQPGDLREFAQKGWLKPI